MKTYHVIIKGRVQGVGFRFFSERAARSLGIKGWIRNNFDGSVESSFQGEDPFCRLFIEQLYKGPPAAQVSTIEEEILDLPPFHNFNIKG